MALNEADAQGDAALAVLRGAPVAEVAARCGVDPEVVRGWVECFVEGGRRRLSGRLDPTSSEARDRFLVLIAHELRTPLTVIGGWVETMQSSELKPEVRDQALAVIHKQVTHLERIARDALDAGAVAEGHLRLLIGPVHLRKLVRSVVASLLDDRIDFRPGPEVEVVGDGSRLEQVTGGLMEHARRLATDGPVTVSVSSDEADATVEVIVDGRALTVVEAAALFEPYGRADNSPGTGVGLYLCRVLVAAHGGDLGIRSGQATTTLWFRLPIAGPALGPLIERA